MGNLIAWGMSEQGRRIIAWALAAIGALVQGGVLPLDMAIPGLGLSLGKLLELLGIGVATVSGSQSRK
jgi:hypothetical protein